MEVYKNESNNTWYVMTRYQDWTGERKQKCKRGFSKPVDEVLPEAGMLESAKSYRDKKAFPVISELKELLYGLYLKYIQIKEQLDRNVPNISFRTKKAER